MDRSDTDGAPGAAPSAESGGGKRTIADFIRARRTIIVSAVLALVILVAGFDQLTSSPLVCGSCHEMGPRTSAWRVSPHANVKCVTCHVEPHPWYAFAQTFAGRASLLAHDLGAHLARPSMPAVDARIAGRPAMPDGVCLQCHDVNRKATSGFRILIDHPKHARRNGSCVSCHVTVAHPKATRGTAMSFMGQCFTCHGTSKSAKAPATCGLCHPKGYQLFPASHRPKEWVKGGRHGKTALADPKQCPMCHERKFCDSCHGLEMPHPKGWARRDGHPVAAKQGRQLCTRCHTDKPDFCSMCHHKGYQPSRGSWVKQHFIEVRKRGAIFCLDCHSPLYCARCHVGGLGG